MNNGEATLTAYYQRQGEELPDVDSVWLTRPCQTFVRSNQNQQQNRAVTVTPATILPHEEGIYNRVPNGTGFIWQRSRLPFGQSFQSQHLERRHHDEHTR